MQCYKFQFNELQVFKKITEESLKRNKHTYRPEINKFSGKLSNTRSNLKTCVSEHLEIGISWQ